MIYKINIAITFLSPSLSLYIYMYLYVISGLFLVIIGQTARTTAMFSARHNFSHRIVDYKAPDHELVKHGIYR